MADNDPTSPNPVVPDGGQPPSKVRRVIGTLMLVIGIVLTGGAGLCSAFFALWFLNFSVAPFIYGLPFMLIGALLWWAGAAVRGKRRKKALPATEEPPVLPPAA
jgi:hypothetical protein